jgi:hypothetical protein
MKRTLLLPLVAVLSLLAAGCDDDGTGVDRATLDDLQGNFTATRLEFRSSANPTERVDLISEDGRLSLQIDREGRFFETFFNPRTGVTETRSGTAEVQGRSLLLSDEGAAGPRVFEFTRTETGLTLRRSNDRFDFNDDAVLDPASFEADLRRSPSS